MKTTAIVLAAGSGRRMGTNRPKQYLTIHGKPLLYYSLAAFEKSDVDEILLVTRREDISYCEEEIVRAYGFEKVAAVIPGGAQRYDSVYQGILHASGDAVLIHDGARPCIRTELIQLLVQELAVTPALVVGVPVKDTIKVTDANGIVTDTPDRSTLWQVQTPQCFHTARIREAFERMYEVLNGRSCENPDVRNYENPNARNYEIPDIRNYETLNAKTSGKENVKITDDAMVMECYGSCPVKMIPGSYENIKVTTREDIRLVESILAG
ncbi:MAG: 2-C-methyl-D-erythritol 4-phosphate cytidylyltransferase [Lachnospiraceae bacterium]|nr:2-C-methyl-D-erythritol 4-phosphate cytidylyltransferase [Lachnospiraceae bacterium]